MNHSERSSLDPATSLCATSELLAPPAQIDGPIGAFEQAKTNFRSRRVESLSNKSLPGVQYPDEPRVPATAHDLAAEDPGVPPNPALRPAGSYPD
jgi:hypothetical protein